MDLRDSKTQKIIIAALAFFIVVYFWYSRVFTVYADEITQKNQTFERITTNLRNVEMKAKSLDALKVEYTDLLGRYEEIEALLPEVKQIPSILVQLHTASSLTGTRIVKVQPLPVASDQFYNEAAFEIEMTGGYHSFGRFISYVANFPFIANVNDVKIEATKVIITEEDLKEEEKEGNTQEVGRTRATVKATFTLSTYFVKENERLAEVTFE